MNSIIELLLGNIGAVIVLAVAGLSLLGKMKINIGNPTEKRPMPPMPSFGGGPGERELPIPSVKPVRHWESQEGVTLEGETGRIGISDSLYPVAATVDTGSTPSTYGTVTGKSSASTAGVSALDTALAPDKGDLRRAVLWAEILGPPRAKRPHGR